MASARANVRRHDLSGEAAQSKRSGGVMETSSEAFPSSLSRRARKAAESARMAAAEAPPPRTSSRIPQTSSRPDQPQSYAWKQTLAQKSRPGNSNASDASGKASTSSYGASSIPSSRSHDSSNNPRNFLRRKSPAVTQNTAPQQTRPRNVSARSDSSSSVPQSQASWDMTDRTNTESPASIRLAQRIEIPSSSQAVTIYPELDRYRDFKPQAQAPASSQHFDLPFLSTNLPPPTPLFSTTSSQHSAFSGSPSTRYSESPGPGPYSRDTTPTSVSSVSPSLSVPIRLPVTRSKPNSPARPPVTQSITRRRAESASQEAYEPSSDHEGLAAVRESSNSSSSGSTVRATGDRDQMKRKGMSPVIPPPRKSSEKFSRSRESMEIPSRTTSRSSHEFASRIAPPRRPSRDGTSDLHSQVGLPVPVVHSNLSSTSLSERRRSGQILPSTVSRNTTPLQTDPSKPPSSHRTGREPISAPNAAGTTSEPQAAKPVRPTRTPSPSIASTLKTRFPLFGRRNKAAAAAPSANADAADKPARKGPAAGTGHEGYGRLGHVRRRSSNLTGAIRAIPGTMSSQSQSQESLASAQPSDPFLAARMSPVVIAGGEIIHNRNVSTDLKRGESNQSIALPRPSFGASRNNSEVSVSSQEARNTLWPSALPRGETPKPAPGHRRMPSDSSDSDVLTMKSTLAFRRSIQRLKAPDQEKARLPKPITVPKGTITPSMDSRDTTLFSDDSTFSLRRPPMQLRTDSDKSTGKKLKKQPKSPRKWNIFGRTTTSKKKQPEEPQVSAAVKPVQKQPMAFYTMLDNPEQEVDEVADVEDVIREARPSRPASPTIPPPAKSEQPPPPPPVSESRQSHEGGRDAPVNVKQSEAKRALKTVTTVPASRDLRKAAAQPNRLPLSSGASKPPSARPSRLPQVGRIPKIATRTDTRVEPPLPSPMSFSRPFNRSSIQLPSPTVAQAPADEFVAKGPSPPQSTAAELDVVSDVPKFAGSETSQPDASVRQSWAKSPEGAETQRQFITFPARKVSDALSSTDSSCSGVLSYSEATAVIPEPNAPLAEDEVWDEYNDLLGDGDVPRGHPSTTSSLGKPFHLEMWGRQMAGRTTQPLETPIVPGNMGAQMEAHIDAAESECETEFEAESQVGLAEYEAGGHFDPAPAALTAYNSGVTAKINEVLEAVGAAQTSPSSVNRSANDNANRNSTELPLQQTRRFSTASSQKARVLRDSQQSCSSRGSDDTSAMAQVNLRVGSMTVSKWLTFGHVLFSPVRDELVPMVGSLKRHSILVIDGLGNDDWSFYAAETYPAATFFNLSPRAPLASNDKRSSSNSSVPLSPPNHHQIQYKSHADKLPFGTQSFTCVVYRFPTAAPESHYRNVINEARRVLKPGGYIELSILDVDMNNMGNNARRAVRRLKERMHTRAPNTSLASSSDLILRLLGRKGFSDIKTCRVGVPLATSAPGSTSSTSSTSKTETSTSSAATRKRSKRETRSLADMMCAGGPGADESITKMVSKVGRWWYDRCYESVALAGGEKSMWQDHAILAECEEWRTSLKLMVCHARIPDGRSRVASI